MALYGIIYKKAIGVRIMQLLKVRSISFKIIVTVLICWILPLAIMLSFNVYYYNNSINSRINDYLGRQFTYCGEFAVERINAAITASKNATYDMIIEDSYDNYIRNKSWSEFYRSVDGYLREKYFLNKKFIASVFFLTDDEDNIIITARNGAEDALFYKENIHRLAAETAKEIDTDIEFIIRDNRAFLVRNMMLVKGPWKRFGVLVLELDTGGLFGHYIQQSQSPVAINISMAKRGEDYIKYMADPNGNLNKEMAEKISAVQHTNIDITPENVVFYHKIKADGYTLSTAAALDKKEIYSQYDNLKNILYLIVVMMVPLILGVFYFMYTNVTRPINSLMKMTRKIEKGSFGVRVENNARSNYEFELLTNSFNSMSSELKRLFEKVYKEQLALRDARILALQSQINPHFLNNTLEMMNWQARMAGDNTVSEMIEALSTLLDSSMDRSERRKIPLSEELRSVDAYLYIISMRFGKRISIEKEIDPSLLSYMVPRLILQPIVENSVIHGIEPAQGGTIIIKLLRTGNQLCISIINNGKALTDGDIEKISKILAEDDDNTSGSERLGLKNVNQRVKLIYGEESGFSIYRDDLGRTVTKIYLPLSEE